MERQSGPENPRPAWLHLGAWLWPPRTQRPPSLVATQPSGPSCSSAWLPKASSSSARTWRSSTTRVAEQPRHLAVVEDVAPLLSAADLQAPMDDVTGLPLIMCPNCKDVQVFAATTMYFETVGKRYFKCPRKGYGNAQCKRFWFEEAYMVFLQDNGYMLSPSSPIAAASTTEVPELVGKFDILEENLNLVKEMVGKNREGMGS